MWKALQDSCSHWIWMLSATMVGTADSRETVRFCAYWPSLSLERPILIRGWETEDEEWSWALVTIQGKDKNGAGTERGQQQGKARSKRQKQLSGKNDGGRAQQTEDAGGSPTELK